MKQNRTKSVLYLSYVNITQTKQVNGAYVWVIVISGFEVNGRPITPGNWKPTATEFLF